MGRREHGGRRRSPSPEGGEERRRKHKKRRRDDKHKHKHKERKSHRRRDSREDAPAPDYERAMAVVRELLTEFPALATDLLGLLQMVDDGEVAVIGGIENRRIRSKLKLLFPLLGLVKLPEPKGAFAKPRAAQAGHGDSVSLMEVFQRMLTSSEPVATTPAETSPAEVQEKKAGEMEEKPMPSKPVKPVKRDAPIGPALPPAAVRAANGGVNPDAIAAVEEEDDDEVVGPALPGMKGFRAPDERVEAEMAQKAQQLEKEQWDRVRGKGGSETNKRAQAEDKKSLARQEWMTVMPENSILKDSLGPTNRPPPGKPVAFRSKEPATVDQSWFDAPEERDRAKRAKLDMELLGYVREENKPSATAAAEQAKRIAAANTQPAVNESILPGANPEADEEMRKQMEQLRQARGPSLLEQHQRKQAEKAKAGGGTTKSTRGWNRERDISARRGMSGDDAKRMITAAKQVHSKFTAPTISRQFL